MDPKSVFQIDDILLTNCFSFIVVLGNSRFLFRNLFEQLFEKNIIRKTLFNKV